MPIRTQRGRAAVYRKFWAWPLRSPLHLVVVVLAVALIASLSVLLSQYARGAGPGEQPSPEAGGGAPAAPATSERATHRPAPPRSGPEPTRLSGLTASPETADPAEAAMTVATKWAKAWVHHPDGTTNKEWLAGMKPYTTPEFLPVMSTVDPANIAATKVTGKPEPKHSYTSSLEVVLPTNGPKLDITVIKTGSGWRVAHYAKAS